MEVIWVFSLVMAAALAAPPPTVFVDAGTPSGKLRVVYVLNYSNKIFPNGGYRFNYDLSDGTSRLEEGVVKNEGLENQYIFVRGFFSYKAPDNVLYRTNYESGIEGYKVENKKVTDDDKLYRTDYESATEEKHNIDDEEGPGGAVPGDLPFLMMG